MIPRLVNEGAVLSKKGPLSLFLKMEETLSFEIMCFKESQRPVQFTLTLPWAPSRAKKRKPLPLYMGRSKIERLGRMLGWETGSVNRQSFLWDHQWRVEQSRMTAACRSHPQSLGWSALMGDQEVGLSRKLNASKDGLYSHPLHYLVNWRGGKSVPPQITFLSPQHVALQYNYNNPLNGLHSRALLFSNLEHFGPHNEYCIHD